MRVNKFVFIISLVFIINACSKSDEQSGDKSALQQPNANQHKVKVEEVIQVTSYTYLKVSENGKELWLAAPKGEFSVGMILLFDRAMEMKDFKSTDLNRTFESILFVDNLDAKLGEGSMNSPQKPQIIKENLKIEAASGGVTIAQLYNSINSYEGKSVKIKGKVVKFNSAIMKTNWVHIQDGTSSGENFDLTITTNENLKVGDIVTFEGKIALNKDFGYGYSYKVLLENAKVSGLKTMSL